MASASDEERLTQAGVAGVTGGIRASLANREERRRFDQLVRTGTSAVEALRIIERRRIPDAGTGQSG